MGVLLSGCVMGSTLPEVQRHVSAAAARLNSAENETDFLAAAELFQLVLELDPDCEAAAYGLEQAQKGRDLIQQQRGVGESKSSHWSLRAGRSAVAGLSMLREGAQRSIAELTELVRTEPDPEPEPEAVAGSQDDCHETAITCTPPVAAIIEDARVETFLSRMDTLMQELGEDEDEPDIGAGNVAMCAASGAICSSAGNDDAVLSPPMHDATLALDAGQDPDTAENEKADETERSVPAEAIE